MTIKNSDMTPEIAAGITRLEEYLIGHAEIRNARIEAQVFANYMPWLTPGQHEYVAHRYNQARLDLTRRLLQAGWERQLEIEKQYESSYHAMRRRFLTRCLASSLYLTVLLLGLASFTVHR